MGEFTNTSNTMNRKLEKNENIVKSLNVGINCVVDIATPNIPILKCLSPRPDRFYFEEKKRRKKSLNQSIVVLFIGSPIGTHFVYSRVFRRFRQRIKYVVLLFQHLVKHINFSGQITTS